MLDLFSGSTLYFVIFTFAFIIALVILCSVFPTLKVMCLTLIGVLLVGSAVYSSVYLNTYYSAEGGIHGHISSLLGTNVVVKEDNGYDLSSISFTLSTNTDEYSAIFYSNEVLDLDKDKDDYIVYINGVPCSTFNVDYDHVSAEYTYVFYDYDNKEMITDTLNIKVSLFDNCSIFYVSTDGGSSAIDYWYSFIYKNGLTLAIK